MNRSAALLIVLSLSLAGCASTGNTFPSLAIRDSERVSGTIAVPAGPPPVVSPAPATLAQLDQLLARIRTGHAEFVAQAPAAARTVAAARGAATGSEAWSVAQVAVAGLEARRSAVMIALADLDRIYVDAAQGEADITALAEALAMANALVDQENATIAELLAGLSA